MKLIINNDDLGLTYGITKGIAKCFQKGITTSSSIIVNGTSFNHTIKIIKTGNLKGIGLGIHLNLTDGPSFSKELADHNGNYKHTFVSLLKGIVLNKKILKFINEDLEDQILKLYSFGVKIDHIDSDKHVHMIPDIFKNVCKLAVKYRIPCVRITREPLFFSYQDLLYPIKTSNICKSLILNSFSKINIPAAQKYHLKFTDAVYGILYTNYMNVHNIESAIKSAQKHNLQTIEILSHPGYIRDPQDKLFISPLMEKYSQKTNRELEMRTLLNIQLKKYIKTNNISLVKFSEI
jgi:predicted glycoside hydrolase/deacetylase ChbG (UPF0249 family)